MSDGVMDILGDLTPPATSPSSPGRAPRKPVSLVETQEPPWPPEERPGVAQLRIPPHSVASESSVLGALLQDNTAWESVRSTLKEADFFNYGHKLIFGAIAELFAGGAPVDVVTVYEQLRELGKGEEIGGLAYLNSLAQFVPSAANITRYALIVRDCAIQRHMVALADEIATAAFNPNGRRVEDLLAHAQQRLATLELTLEPAQQELMLSVRHLEVASENTTWTIKHVLPANAVGMMFGAPGTFKSFIALDMALHIAHGLPWLGRRTTKGPVIYIAAEGGTGLWRRIKAWHQARNMGWDAIEFFVVPVAVELQGNAQAVVAAAAIAGVVPLLVVVDTLSQTFQGEENNASDMASYLRALGVAFRAPWGCSVVVIHHSGHAATERPRGSSAITGNVDFLMGVFRDEKELLATLTNNRQKDGEPFADASFALTPTELGRDEDGDPVSSLVARHLTSAEEVHQVMAEEGKAGRVGKNQLLLRLLQNGMPESELRHAFYEDCGIDNQDSRRQAYHRAKAWAIKAGFFEVAEGIVITLKKA